MQKYASCTQMMSKCKSEFAELKQERHWPYYECIRKSKCAFCIKYHVNPKFLDRQASIEDPDQKADFSGSTLIASYPAVFKHVNRC